MRDLLERLISWIARKNREYNAWCWRNNEFY